MILVDSSVWIDHLRKGEPDLVIALSERRVVQHPFVTLELSLGAIPDRLRFIEMLRRLPQATVSHELALIEFIDEAELPGTGVGLIDAHLLAASARSSGIQLWTHDKRLAKQAERLGLAAEI